MPEMVACFTKLSGGGNARDSWSTDSMVDMDFFSSGTISTVLAFGLSYSTAIRARRRRAGLRGGPAPASPLSYIRPIDAPQQAVLAWARNHPGSRHERRPRARPSRSRPCRGRHPRRLLAGHPDL